MRQGRNLGNVLFNDALNTYVVNHVGYRFCPVQDKADRNVINWLSYLSCNPRNDELITCIITVSFD